MPADSKPQTIREAVGVFESPTPLTEAIDELLSSGFDRAELSLLAADKTVDKKLGHVYQSIAAFEDDAAVPRCCYVSNASIGAGAVISQQERAPPRNANGPWDVACPAGARLRQRGRGYRCPHALGSRLSRPRACARVRGTRP